MSAHTPKVVEVFSCSDCARTPATVDEDGCCASCGADCRVVRLVDADEVLAAVERFRDARFKALLAIAKARKILRHAHPTSKVTEAYLALDWRNRS